MLRRYGLALFILAILSPLGLLAQGNAWGEWDADNVQEVLGYVPQGMERFGGLWRAAFPDYSVSFLGGGSFGQSLGYVFSALLGSAVIYFLVVAAAKLALTGKRTGGCKNQ